MRKTHTFTQTLTANTFNAYDSTGDGVLWLGTVLFDGMVASVGGYRVRYNGIIVEDLDLFTQDMTGYKYLCIVGVDASPSSTPYALATNTKQGVCLLEEYSGGWITKGRVFNGDFRGLPFSRSSDSTGTIFYVCYGPGVCNDGTTVHTPVKLPWVLDQVSGSRAQPGVSDIWSVKNTTALGAVTAYGCNGHLVIYSEAVGPSIEIKNNRLYTSDTILAAIGESLSVMETSPTHCVYAYSTAGDLYIGTCEYGVAAAAPVTYSFTTNIAHIDFVTPTTIAIEFADNTFIYGRIMPATIDTIFSGSSRWFYVDKKTGDFVHVGTDDKLYKNTVEIGSTTHFAFIHDGHILQVSAIGEIYHGGKIVNTGYLATNIVANRTTANELFFMFINGAGIDVVSYDVWRGDTTYSNGALVGSICASTFADIATLYLGTDEVTYEDSLAPGSALAEPSIEILPSEDSKWRYGKKTFHISGDYASNNLYVRSNTNGVLSYDMGVVYLGVYETMTVADNTKSPIMVGPAVCDCDHLEYVDIMSGKNDYVKCLACDYDGEQKSAYITTLPTSPILAAPHNFISGNIQISGGSVSTMNVYAADSVVYNMTITDLQVYVAKNVLFIGCTIGAYTDNAVAPNTNEYLFIGCTIGGIPANTFLGLTDTPMAYVNAGDMLVTNAAVNGLEFAIAARQTAAGALEFARQDMVDGVLTPTFDEPASLEIHKSIKDPTGFEDISNCTIAYDPGTRILSLTFTGDTHIWFNGVRHTFTNGQSFTWAAHTDDSGCWFFYLQDDGAGGIEAAAPNQVFWDLSLYIPVSYVLYKDTGDGGPDGFENEERHGHTWPWSIHRDLHLQRGSWTPGGFEASGYVVDSNAFADKQIDIAEGDIVDEDLWTTQAAFAAGVDSYVHFYLVNGGNDWTWTTGNTLALPFLSGGSENPQYNAGGAGLTEITDNNRWFNTYIFATNSLNPTYRFVVIIGQQLYTSLSGATGESVGSLSLGSHGAFPFQECVALYQVTWRRGPYSGGATDPNARIAAFTRIIGERVTIAGLASTSHATLTNRDDPGCHPATAISYDNTTSELVDTDAQGAIDELSSGFAKIINEAEYDSAVPTFDAIEIMPKFLPIDDCVFSCEIDAIATTISDTCTGVPTAPGTMSHRRIMATVHVASGAPDTYTILAQDTTIFYEDAEFTAVRVDPVIHLGAGATDCIELYTDGGEFGVIVRGIKYIVSFIGPDSTTASVTRYSITFNINSVTYV